MLVMGSPLGSMSKSLLLFTLNWLDAQLTLLWIRTNVATEGNSLMARIISHSETSFLIFKLAIGAFAAYTLYRCAHIPLARKGMSVVLIVYFFLMVIHVAIGVSALGWQGPLNVLILVERLPQYLSYLFA
jgi:hypothetical protein